MPQTPDDSFDWSASPELPRFLRQVVALTTDERQVIIAGAKAALDGFYVHMADKCTGLGIDPLGDLDRLSKNLPQADDDIGFHDAMCDIFAGLNDLHTHYTLPDPYRSWACILPFKLGEYRVGGHRRVLVTELQQSYADHPPPDQVDFKEGAEILTWNEQPIQNVVADFARRSGGAHEDARRARALAAMTLRPMQRLPPPRQPVVLLSYRVAGHAPGQPAIFPWRVIAVADEEAHPSLKAYVGLDHEGEMRRRASTRAYHPGVLGLARRARNAGPQAPAMQALPTLFPTVFKAHKLPQDERFGYIRIFSFAAENPGLELPDFITLFVDDFATLLAGLPSGGLVLDVRGNSGGILPLAESLLQTLTDRTITPQPVELRATPEVLALCRSNDELTAYLPSVEAAIAQDRRYSAGLPITDPAWCNGRTRAFNGPVVLLVDARCYSATDAFVAGFQDHAIGKVLGVASATGAGGANVWSLDDLLAVPGAGLQRWAKGAGMKVALRRTRRVGPHEGELLEGVGVKPDLFHTLTFDDLLRGDHDLMAAAAASLS
jgi:C-terminal processing protease CtpA/Prc